MNEPTQVDQEISLTEIVRHLSTIAHAADRALTLIENRLAPALERIAGSLEQGVSIPSNASVADRSISGLAAIREAIRNGNWVEAENQLRALSDLDHESAETETLFREISEGKQSAILGARARLEAAKAVHDPTQIMEARDILAQLLPSADRLEIDREIVRGLMVILQKRLRGGKISAEVADLAARMADRFVETSEGASLRAALPTLRRSAGLCPKCAGPYRGIEDACPKCLGRTGPIAEEEEILDTET